MIFVTVGTNEAPFDRLLEGLDALNLDEELVVQHGPSAIRPRGAECHEFLTFDQVVEHVRASRVVISHAGVGSVLVALANDKHPIVVPRLRQFGEAVDDHQLAFARRLHREGVLTCVERREAFELVVITGHPPAPPRRRSGKLVDDLHSYLIDIAQSTAAT
jgi:exopolysaccharide biosynthesis glucuronosyltransferase PssE